MRATLVCCWLLAACGRINFGYPLAPCEDVTANATVLWEQNDHCYTRHEVPVSLAEAAGACGALGGHLASISQSEENATIVAGLSPDIPVRIGLSGSSTWQWDTQEPATYANWSAGQPSIACVGSTNSAVLGPDGFWSVVCFTDGYPYVCEIEPWLVRDADGHRYRVHWSKVDWFGASGICEGFGGHLATITSLEELTFVEAIVTTDIWIGAQTPGGGVFEWVTGEPFGGFAPWAPSEPNGPGMQCVVSRAGGGWIDENCTTDFRALCEVD